MLPVLAHSLLLECTAMLLAHERVPLCVQAAAGNGLHCEGGGAICGSRAG